MKKLLKKKLKQILAISMALSMILCTNAFATPIDLVNSTESVATDTLNKTEGTDYFDDEDTNVWKDGQITERVDVTVQRESQFEVTIPKDIVLDGETGKADYKVKAKGDIAGDQILKVVPDTEFEMTEAGGKASVTATVTQPDTEYTYVKIQGEGTEYDGSVEATLTAGEWAGKFAFNISFEGERPAQKGDPLEKFTWNEIAAISEAGEATNYFSIGDTKTMTLTNGETYNAEIIGFNHDDLVDENGNLTGEKAGITFQFKELMTTGHNMNSTNTNAGGWEASEMRTYVNNDVYNLLPADLQGEIKTVDKVSDVGNDDKTTLIHTSDKLFLLSYEEVGFTSSNSSYFVEGQGEKYEYYTDRISRIKNLSGSAARWWLRSTITIDIYYFFDVGTDGGNYYYFSYSDHGVAPAFCI